MTNGDKKWGQNNNCSQIEKEEITGKITRNFTKGSHQNVARRGPTRALR